MYDIGVGRIRLDLHRDGTGVVVRMGAIFNRGEERVPLEPEDAEKMERMHAQGRAACLLCLGGSGLSLAGAVRLLVVGWIVVGIALAVVGLALLVLGLIFLLMWRHRADRGQFVVLDPSQVEQFRSSAEAERQALGEKATTAEGTAERHQAEERLWKLASRLASGAEPESAKPRAAPWLRGRRQQHPRVRRK
jgi:hypothetical protein